MNALGAAESPSNPVGSPAACVGGVATAALLSRAIGRSWLAAIRHRAVGAAD